VPPLLEPPPPATELPPATEGTQAEASSNVEAPDFTSTEQEALLGECFEEAVAAFAANETPPGYAVIDTGCTASLIGSAQVPLWHEALKLASQGKLEASSYQDSTKFKGINGIPTPSQGGIAWPTRIGGKLGTMRTSIVSGQAPCLLSISALRSLGAKLDLSGEVPTICFSRITREAIPLSYAPNGHLLMPLFNFFKNTKRLDAQH
jgi:hypothetical protein